ncbi:hypothetical protein BC829DRAFT_447026 [Chytridium lagenaria]|nr:hypothetical protein BC829DRAFT_447026 [Chytridium lagenaria]
MQNAQSSFGMAQGMTSVGIQLLEARSQDLRIHFHQGVKRDVNGIAVSQRPRAVPRKRLSDILSDSSSPTFKRMKLSTDNDNSLPKRTESIPVGRHVKPLIKVTMMNSLERRKMKEKVYLQKAAKIFDIRQDASNVTEATSGNSIRDISNISKILQRSYTERTTTGSRHMEKVQNECDDHVEASFVLFRKNGNVPDAIGQQRNIPSGSPQPLRKYEKGLSKLSCDLRDPAFRRAGERAVNIRASSTSQAAEVVLCKRMRSGDEDARVTELSVKMNSKRARTATQASFTESAQHPKSNSTVPYQIPIGSSVVRSVAGAQHTYRKAIQKRSALGPSLT